jgi:RimJ/RimL family protein N-acetyltransferase
VGVEGVGTPPYRIETERLVIRCYDPSDATILEDAVWRSRDHLWTFMPWTPAEREDISTVVERLRAFRAEFDRDENWIYGIFSRDESRIVGGTGFHPRGGPGALEIGYWVAAEMVRQGIATETSAVLTRAAFEHAGVDRVDIGADARNEASLGVGRKLGFHEDGVLRRRIAGRPGETRGDMIYMTMLREEYEQATWRDAYPYAAFDAAGDPLAAQGV